VRKSSEIGQHMVSEPREVVEIGWNCGDS
jgi:hypothetical protein